MRDSRDPSDPSVRPIDLQRAVGVQVGSHNVQINQFFDQAGSLVAAVWSPVRAFLVDFEIYLQHVGDLEDQLQLIPDGMWPLIDGTAYTLADAFIGRHDLQRELELPSLAQVAGDHLREALAFLLKVAWERGYFMCKFHKFDHLPPPTAGINPITIMDRITALGSRERTNLAANIEVFLQRAVSLSTSPQPVRESLSTVDDNLATIVEPFLEDWSAVVRSAHGWGILSAKVECELE